MKPLLLTALAASATAIDIFRSKQQAHDMLTRHRRDNKGIFEEVAAANLQRECIDEVCSYDEVLEAMNGDEGKATSWWNASTRMCMEDNTCFGPGTKICINQWRKRECRCRSGWTKTKEKDDCSIDVDECADPNWCANGGVCTNTQGGFVCDCPATWEGEKCEQDVNECEGAVSPCQNDGVCTNIENGFTCACTDKWEGATCEIDIDECERDNPCQNDSGCINNQGGYECLCNNGWGGQDCHEDYDECANAHCPEGTTCMVVNGTMNQFTCVCPERGCNNLDEEIYNSKFQSIFIPEVELVPEDYSFEDGNSTALIDEETLESDEGLDLDEDDSEIDADDSYDANYDESNYSVEEDDEEDDDEGDVYEATVVDTTSDYEGVESVDDEDDASDNSYDYSTSEDDDGFVADSDYSYSK